MIRVGRGGDTLKGRRRRVAAAQLDLHDVTHLVLQNRMLHPFEVWVKAPLQRCHQLDASRIARVDGLDLLERKIELGTLAEQRQRVLRPRVRSPVRYGLLEVCRDGLLAEGVLARCGACLDLVCVEGRWRADPHRLDVRMIDHLWRVVRMLTVSTPSSTRSQRRSSSPRGRRQ
jgi:hypothetical protein